MIETLGLASRQLLIVWVTLFITGRIYDRIFSDTEPATIKDDALAAFGVVVITGVAAIPVFYLGLPTDLLALVYFGLIYYAFQLDGMHGIVFFYLLHIAINLGVSFLGFGLFQILE